VTPTSDATMAAFAKRGGESKGMHDGAR
jgi:hypothetical protein